MSSDHKLIEFPEWNYVKTVSLRAVAWFIDLAIVSLPIWIAAWLLPGGLTVQGNQALFLCKTAAGRGQIDDLAAQLRIVLALAFMTMCGTCDPDFFNCAPLADAHLAKRLYGGTPLRGV